MTQPLDVKTAASNRGRYSAKYANLQKHEQAREAEHAGNHKCKPPHYAHLSHGVNEWKHGRRKIQVAQIWNGCDCGIQLTDGTVVSCV